MSKAKKIWSVVLLCALILIAVCMVAFVLGIGKIFDAEPESSIAGAISVLLVVAAFVFALPMLCGSLAAVGIIIAIVNIKISQSRIIKGISIGFAALYGLILVCSFAWGACAGLMFV